MVSISLRAASVGQLRVGIQCDHRRRSQAADARSPKSRDHGPFVAAQKRIQLFQFSAFALAANPALLAFGPDARPVEQQESVSPIASIQTR